MNEQRRSEMEWHPIENYDPSKHPGFVIIGGENWWSMGTHIKYWHDLADGDLRVTSPSHPQPTHFALPQPPQHGDTQ